MPCWLKNSLARLLPPALMTSSCACVHSSISTERTNVTCVPSPRCCPEQSRQMKMPKVDDAHVGFRAGQSKHTCGDGGRGRGRRSAEATRGTGHARPRASAAPARAQRGGLSAARTYLVLPLRAELAEEAAAHIGGHVIGHRAVEARNPTDARLACRAALRARWVGVDGGPDRVVKSDRRDETDADRVESKSRNPIADIRHPTSDIRHPTSENPKFRRADRAADDPGSRKSLLSAAAQAGACFACDKVQAEDLSLVLRQEDLIMKGRGPM